MRAYDLQATLLDTENNTLITVKDHFDDPYWISLFQTVTGHGLGPDDHVISLHINQIDQLIEMLQKFKR
jgi:hypothetical protein